MKDKTQVFAMSTSLKVEAEVVIANLSVVCEFSYVFLDDISDLPPESEVKLTIDLVSGTKPVSIAPYRVSVSNLSELKKQLEGLQEDKLYAKLSKCEF